MKWFLIFYICNKLPHGHNDFSERPGGMQDLEPTAKPEVKLCHTALELGAVRPRVQNLYKHVFVPGCEKMLPSQQMTIQALSYMYSFQNLGESEMNSLDLIGQKANLTSAIKTRQATMQMSLALASLGSLAVSHPWDYTCNNTCTTHCLGCSRTFD